MMSFRKARLRQPFDSPSTNSGFAQGDEAGLTFVLLTAVAGSDRFRQLNNLYEKEASAGSL